MIHDSFVQQRFLSFLKLDLQINLRLFILFELFLELVNFVFIEFDLILAWVLGAASLLTFLSLLFPFCESVCN